jgi:signal recognition particle subunit SRP54
MLDNLTRRFTDIVGGLRGKKITESNVQETVKEIRRALLEADVALPVVKQFVQRVKEEALGTEVIEGVDAGQHFIKIVKDSLTDLMGPEDPEIEWRKKGPTIILMAGLQGSGKTTTCGKLARYLRDRKNRRPLLVAADLQRPAAIEQLKVLGRTLDIPVFHEPGLSPPEVCERAVKEAAGKGCDTVILDTAGRLHIDAELMGELKQVARRTEPDEIFLVVDAMTGQDAVNSAREFNEALELSGVVLTKLDGDARGGSALSVKSITGKPIKFIGVGEKLDKLEPFHPERMAGRILGMGDVTSLVELAQDKLDQEKQAEMQQKMLEARFDLDDFLQQLGQLKKLGSVKDLLGKLPGLGAQMGDMDIGDDDMKSIECIIQSMTTEERRRPEILNTSRRKRIARGSGRTVDEVSDLLKQFKQMQQVMQQLKQFQQGGMFGKLKGLGAMRKQLKGQSAHEIIEGMGGASATATLPSGGPALPGQNRPAAPGNSLFGALAGQPPAAKATGKARPSKDAIRKKRKQERSRKKKNRRG